MRRRGGRRQRGATYTLVVLSMSVGLLVAGTTLTGAARNTFRIAAEQGRQMQARQAAFAGVRWAAAAARAGAPPSQAALALAGATVRVRSALRAEDRALLVTSTADLGERALQVDAVLLPAAEGAYRLETFEAKAVPPEE